MSTDRYVTANGIELHYIEYPGDGPTLVLTHGLSANARFFDVLAPALAPLRVLSFDLRGRGLSEKPAHGYSMAEHAADLLGALDALGLDRVVLGGHSFGGFLTLYVAATSPERVERALLLDVPAQVDAGVLDQIGPSLARLDRTYGSAAEYVELARGLPYFDDESWDAAIATWFEADLEDAPGGGLRPRSRPEHIRACVEATFAEDWAALAARVECPVLLLRTVGSYGPPGSPPILSAEDAQRTYARLRDAALVEVPGNHLTFAFGDRAAVAAAAVRGFVTAPERDSVTA